jgi:hypothetical protein
MTPTTEPDRLFAEELARIPQPQGPHPVTDPIEEEE